MKTLLFLLFLVPGIAFGADPSVVMKTDSPTWPIDLYIAEQIAKSQGTTPTIIVESNSLGLATDAFILNHYYKDRNTNVILSVDEGHGDRHRSTTESNDQLQKILKSVGR